MVVSAFGDDAVSVISWLCRQLCDDGTDSEVAVLAMHTIAFTSSDRILTPGCAGMTSCKNLFFRGSRSILSCCFFNARRGMNLMPDPFWQDTQYAENTGEKWIQKELPTKSQEVNTSSTNGHLEQTCASFSFLVVPPWRVISPTFSFHRSSPYSTNEFTKLLISNGNEINLLCPKQCQKYHFYI